MIKENFKSFLSTKNQNRKIKLSMMMMKKKRNNNIKLNNRQKLPITK